jgi:hypothetical protein
MENKPFVGFASISVSDGISWKFRIAKITSTFTTGALAIGETLEIIYKIHSEQNVVIFSDSESVPKEISDTSTMENTSHIPQMLRDKTERLESRWKKIQFYWIPEQCGFGVNEGADSEEKQSTKEGRDSQLLLPVEDLKAQLKKKGKEEFHSFCQNTKRDRGGSYFQRYYRNGSSPWFHVIKMNLRTFVLVNRMRPGHSSLKASLSRFGIVSTAECECGDGLQTEEHIFWDCKLYEDQRATMMNILFGNSRKEYPNSIT